MKLFGLNSPEIFIILIVLLSILGPQRIEKGLLLLKKLLKFLLSEEETKEAEAKLEEPEKDEVKEETKEAEAKLEEPEKDEVKEETKEAEAKLEEPKKSEVKEETKEEEAKL
ncbi:cell surface protein, partial [Prochlorococcus marinus CUG1416]|nr:cell surface protein [Prochlorococcus marinus CUG1416]